jgi:hypothetical protein
MQYISQSEDNEAERFEVFINSNVGTESFMEILCREYPEFEKLLIAEMSAFKSEINFN